MSTDLTRSQDTQTLEINIEKLVYGGEGLGRHESGEILFVPWSAPGDRLRLARVPGNQKPARGKLEAVLEAGPDRTEAPCSVFGACGGCQWQHLSLSAQREWKRKIVQESLERIGKLSGIKVLPTIGSDETAWHYRNRVQWEVSPEGLLGYYQAGSHEVVQFDHCWIIPEPLNQLADWLQRRLKSDPALARRLKRIEAVINEKQEILLSLEPVPGQELNRLAAGIKAALPDVVGIVSVTADGNGQKRKTLEGQGFLQEQLGGRNYKVSSGSFFQTNEKAAAQLLDVLDSWFPPDAGSLIDIFAGVGVFAIHFADRAQSVLAVESAPVATKDAQENIAENGKGNVALITGDAGRIVPGLREEFDVAILDPPRAGCRPEILHWLGKHIQRQILYVSCNPTTLARDLKTLTGAGWKIEAVQPLDMFPQTYHVETLVSLKR